MQLTLNVKKDNSHVPQNNKHVLGQHVLTGAARLHGLSAAQLQQRLNKGQLHSESM